MTHHTVKSHCPNLEKIFIVNIFYDPLDVQFNFPNAHKICEMQLHFDLLFSYFTSVQEVKLGRIRKFKTHPR